MRRKFLTKRRIQRHREALRRSRGAFTALRNKTLAIHAKDYLAAGYPMVWWIGHKWKEIHELCKETFPDHDGHSTYTWCGNQFFFLTEEDAALFRALQLMV